jgi:hypothetical protein
MHKFGSGYHDAKPSLSITHELTRRDAEAVRDLLNDWLEDDEQLHEDSEQ